MISNNAFASLEGVVLICNNDKAGYNFISKDQVKISSINLNKPNKFYINHYYDLAVNAIFIQQPIAELNKRKKTNPLDGYSEEV